MDRKGSVMAGGWIEAYSVGNAVLDAQHRELLRLCHDVERLIGDTSREGNDRLHEDLSALMDYARTHFTTEEQLLQAANYPDLPTQVNEHFAYIEKLSGMLMEAIDHRLDAQTLHRYLTDWWQRHILESDMHYKGFLDGR